MKKLLLLVLISSLFVAACSKKATLSQLEGIYPGMTCSDLDAYMAKTKAPFKKEGKVYSASISEKGWESLSVTCDGVVIGVEYNSIEGSTAKHAKSYIDAQELLLRTFRGNLIKYEEGNKVININNGIRLHQFSDSKTGAITHFRISVDNSDGAKLAWESVSPKLSSIGEWK
jgi:hypothetical protein